MSLSIDYTNSTITTNTSVSDSVGNLRSLIINDQTSAYQLASTDNGKVVTITTGGITVNGAVLTTGHNNVIFNKSDSTQMITVGTGATMYFSGSSTSSSRTLAIRGVCAITMIASNTFIITGSLT